MSSGEPRKNRLRPEQIESILQDIPLTPGIGKTARKVATEHSKDRLRAVLEDINVSFDDKYFEPFKLQIIETYYRSLIEPNTAVGADAGVALGGPITQLSLNTFHFAGLQSGVAQAFQRVREFLTGSKSNREPEMTIFFRRPGYVPNLHWVKHVGTPESVFGYRPDFEETYVSDIVLEYEILYNNDIITERIPEIMALFIVFRPERFVQGIRYSRRAAVKLQLNRNRMYSHRINMMMLARAIEGSYDVPDAVTCIWESELSGVMYVIIENKDFKQESESLTNVGATVMFINKVFRGGFSSWLIRGMENVSKINLDKIDVIGAITRVRALDNGKVRVFTSQHKTRWEGASLVDIAELIYYAFNTAVVIVETDLCVEFDYNGRPEKIMDRLRMIVKEQNDISDFSKLLKDVQRQNERFTSGVLSNAKLSDGLKLFGFDPKSHDELIIEGDVAIVQERLKDLQAEIGNVKIVQRETGFGIVETTLLKRVFVHSKIPHTTQSGYIVLSTGPYVLERLNIWLTLFAESTEKALNSVKIESANGQTRLLLSEKSGSPQELKAILDLLGVKIVQMPYVEVQSPNVSDFDKIVEDKLTRSKNILQNATIFYMKTNGINESDIVWMDEVDQFRFMTNSSHGICRDIGIDAARTYLVQKFIRTLSSFSSYINTLHISLIFDVLTNMGMINSLTFSGINRRQIGPLATATNEQGMKVIMGASTIGGKDTLSGISASLCIGQKSKQIGTGAVVIIEDTPTPGTEEVSRPTADELTQIAFSEVPDLPSINELFGPNMSWAAFVLDELPEYVMNLSSAIAGVSSGITQSKTRKIGGLTSRLLPGSPKLAPEAKIAPVAKLPPGTVMAGAPTTKLPPGTVMAGGSTPKLPP